MKDDYVSPFRLPEFKCTSPKDAQSYPALHAVDAEGRRFPYAGKRCPVHNDDFKKETTHWRDWAYWREQYAKPGATDDSRQYAMHAMLAEVTLDNPPDNALEATKGKERKVRVKTWYDIDGRPHHYVKERPSDAKLMAVSVISVILAVCMLTCFLAILL